jgi:polygalacturonase
MDNDRVSRRDFVRAALAGATLLGPASLLGCAPAVPAANARRTPAASGAAGWDLVPEILARIRAPEFPARAFVVTDFGAVADGATLATEAFRRAIEACHNAGGGRVVVPQGRFLTGPIHLKSNVNLHVDSGATVAFSQNPAHYLPAVFTRWEGVELMGYSPLIYAWEAENVAVTGEGVLDGQADCAHWWPWKGRTECGWKEGDPRQHEARDRLFQMAEQGVPVEQRVFADGSYLRPQFIQPYRCRNVLIEGITIRNSPMWEVHPVLCQNVTVRGVKIDTHGPNNDGCDPESCRDVLIENCYFDTGDDCIALKSGRNADGRRLGVPIENVVIRNCRMKDGHGGVTIGSEISGGARNIFAENCVMDSPHLERALRFKTNAMRGGVIEHVYMRNCTVGQVEDAVVSINYYYEEGDKGDHLPLVRDIEVRNVTSQRSAYALFLRGFPNDPIREVRLVDCTFQNVEKGNVVEHVTGLELERVAINGRLVDEEELAR